MRRELQAELAQQTNSEHRFTLRGFLRGEAFVKKATTIESLRRGEKKALENEKNTKKNRDKLKESKSNPEMEHGERPRHTTKTSRRNTEGSNTDSNGEYDHADSNDSDEIDSFGHRKRSQSLLEHNQQFNFTADTCNRLLADYEWTYNILEQARELEGGNEFLFDVTNMHIQNGTIEQLATAAITNDLNSMPLVPLACSNKRSCFHESNPRRVQRRERCEICDKVISNTACATRATHARSQCFLSIFSRNGVSWPQRAAVDQVVGESWLCFSRVRHRETGSQTERGNAQCELASDHQQNRRLRVMPL